MSESATKGRPRWPFLLHSGYATFGVSVVSLGLGIAYWIGYGESSPSLPNTILALLYAPPLYSGPMAVGLFFGFFTNRRLKDSVARWAWVLPALLWAGVGGPIYDWFGEECVICVHKLVSIPFFTAVGYSIGAILGKRWAETVDSPENREV